MANSDTYPTNQLDPTLPLDRPVRKPIGRGESIAGATAAVLIAAVLVATLCCWYRGSPRTSNRSRWSRRRFPRPHNLPRRTLGREARERRPLPLMPPFTAEEARQHQQAWADYLGMMRS